MDMPRTNGPKHDLAIMAAVWMFLALAILVIAEIKKSEPTLNSKPTHFGDRFETR